eukprot:NODE_2161_length_2279_cov_9.491636.p1 GENE.NODE_2161_length_2279_cov_9.491636~~NODE_2161_length_2279_cov_9.491636.p1  ORF type:complete len:506 (+),score=158.07 NODE_2161_length_2279_cov_9.491636:155-1672(+)
MYALVGLMYGFVLSYMSMPICQYVFGPMGAPGRSTLQQCNVGVSVATLPWTFKVFYGFALDRIGFCGTRRRGWVIFGWSAAMLPLAALALFSDVLAERGDFATYALLQMLISFFYVISDVAGDGMTIELSKAEPIEVRGHILTTGQLVRFVASIAVNMLGILAMNGKDYYPNVSKANETIFPFELSFGNVHLVLLCACLPFYLGMVVLLKDPPLPLDSNALATERKRSVMEVMAMMWSLMKTKVMLFLIIFPLANMTFCCLQNPAGNVVGAIASPSTLQLSVGNFVGQLLFAVGVWIFRTYFMQTNWRVTFMWTAVLLATNNCFQLLVIFNAWGVGQDGWFYALGGSALSLITGVQQVLSSLAVVEISPAGYEATVYEIITTVHNAGITLCSNFQNLLVPVFALNDIDALTYTAATRDDYNARMCAATVFTLVLNVVTVPMFMGFLPKDKAQCAAWLKDPRWMHMAVGVVSVVLTLGSLLLSFGASLLSIFPQTMCLRIAGGTGC